MYANERIGPLAARAAILVESWENGCLPQPPT